MSMNINSIIGNEMFFVHKGTWSNGYEWRIEKVIISGVKIDDKKQLHVEFSFNCCGYEYPLSYLKPTMPMAKNFAIRQIKKEKERQINQIKKY